MKTIHCLAGLGLALGLAGGATAATITVDFENLPTLAAQPNNFAAAGAMQTYSSAGVFSISGGVVLGNPGFLAAFPGQGSSPNLYGTTDFADPSLLDTITLDLDPTQLVTSVNAKIFNGQTQAEDYRIRVFSGLSTLVQQTFLGVQDNTDINGFRNFSFGSTLANPITKVTFSSPNASVNGWDFFVDTIQFITNPAVIGVPEPATWALVPAALLLLGSLRRRANASEAAA